jgi:hypothetical protein
MRPMLDTHAHYLITSRLRMSARTYKQTHTHTRCTRTATRLYSTCRTNTLPHTPHLQPQLLYTPPAHVSTHCHTALTHTHTQISLSLSCACSLQALFHWSVNYNFFLLHFFVLCTRSGTPIPSFAKELAHVYNILC